MSPTATTVARLGLGVRPQPSPCCCHNMQGKNTMLDFMAYQECPHCSYWSYKASDFKRHLEKYHKDEIDSDIEDDEAENDEDTDVEDNNEDDVVDMETVVDVPNDENNTNDDESEMAVDVPATETVVDNGESEEGKADNDNDEVKVNDEVIIQAEESNQEENNNVATIKHDIIANEVDHDRTKVNADRNDDSGINVSSDSEAETSSLRGVSPTPSISGKVSRRRRRRSSNGHQRRRLRRYKLRTLNGDLSGALRCGDCAYWTFRPADLKSHLGRHS